MNLEKFDIWKFLEIFTKKQDRKFSILFFYLCILIMNTFFLLVL